MPVSAAASRKPSIVLLPAAARLNPQTGRWAPSGKAPVPLRARAEAVRAAGQVLPLPKVRSEPAVATARAEPRAAEVRPEQVVAEVRPEPAEAVDRPRTAATDRLETAVD
jgi:hypothetical protein